LKAESQKSIFWYQIPAIIWGAFILVVSWTTAGINLPERLFDFISTDKLAHAIVYGIFSWLIVYGVKKSGQVPPKIWFSAILLASVYGVLMEILQYYFFPGRYFELLDILADIIGAFIGILVFRFFSTFVKRL
jgi:VanZ family protein